MHNSLQTLVFRCSVARTVQNTGRKRRSDPERNLTLDTSTDRIDLNYAGVRSPVTGRSQGYSGRLRVESGAPGGTTQPAEGRSQPTGRARTGANLTLRMSKLRKRLHTCRQPP